MSSDNSKLILTVKSIDFIDKSIVNQIGSSSFVCNTGQLKSLTMIENQVLQLIFNNCELDIDLSFIDLLSIKDEVGNVLITSEKS